MKVLLSIALILNSSPQSIKHVVESQPPGDIDISSLFSTDAPPDYFEEPMFVAEGETDMPYGGFDAIAPAGFVEPLDIAPMIPETVPDEFDLNATWDMQEPPGFVPEFDSFPQAVEVGRITADEAESAAMTSAVAPADYVRPHTDNERPMAPCGDCLTGDVIEGEVDCVTNYNDVTNGGCNSTPPVFGPKIECGQSVCGTYGTFLNAGANFRDTDWYRFTLPVAASVTWTAVGEATTRVFILDDVCPSVSLGTAAAGPCQPASVTLNLAAGSYYAFVGTDAFTGVLCGSKYRATLTTTPCCVPACEPGDIPEGEVNCFTNYNDVTNGGCNSTPPVFGPKIECGQSVCGTYGTFLNAGANNRDTDWYRFTLPVASQVTWTAVGEAATRVFILDDVCPAVSLGTANAAACQPASVTLNLAAGSYYAFVGTDVFTGVPCGARYRAKLTVQNCCVQPCRPGDLTEGEPDCTTNYNDAFNGGCNSTPNVFGSIACGQTVCGRYGTFLNAGANNRDTDWYRFTITQTSNVTWTAIGEATTRVFILTNVCPTASLATAAAPACQPATVTINNLAPGTYIAFVGTDIFTGVPCGARYRATLTTSTCCSIKCTPGDRENEPTCGNGYVDSFNTGCNAVPNIYSPLDCEKIICGTYGTYLSGAGAPQRDTDWYRFTVPAAGPVRWSVVGDADTLIAILDDVCPASAIGFTNGAPCQQASVTVNLAAGSYYAFVATTGFTGVPCGSRYRASLTALACCDPCDANCDGSVNQFDINPFIQTLASGTGCSSCSGDTNKDGTINTFDINSFIQCLIP